VILKVVTLEEGQTAAAPTSDLTELFHRSGPDQEKSYLRNFGKSSSKTIYNI
jgi:hypothetical protein